MIIDELKKIKPLGDDISTEGDEGDFDSNDDMEDDIIDPLEPDDTDDDEDNDYGTIIRDVADYDRKIDLLRAYVGFYSELELELMFDTTSLMDILTKYTYNQVRSRLVNTKSNTLEAGFDIGDIVEINKPVLRNDVYTHDDGMIIGKHLVFDDKDRNRSPLYHTQYDILVQSEQYIDGFSYEIKRERARDLILKEYTVDNVESVMNEFASYQIEKNV